MHAIHQHHALDPFQNTDHQTNEALANILSHSTSTTVNNGSTFTPPHTLKNQKVDSHHPQVDKLD